MKEIRLQKDNFKENVLDQKGYVLVDFWASWCGPCKMLAPVLSQIAEENDDIIVGKVNVDEEMKLAQAFKIQSIPTVILFKDGININPTITEAIKPIIKDRIDLVSNNIYNAPLSKNIILYFKMKVCLLQYQYCASDSYPKVSLLTVHTNCHLQ